MNQLVFLVALHDTSYAKTKHAASGEINLQKNIKQTHSKDSLDNRMEPRPHLWKASSLTSASSSALQQTLGPEPQKYRVLKPIQPINNFVLRPLFSFKDPIEATGRGENVFVAGGDLKTFTCPVDGNPKPNIEWFSEKTGRKISSGKRYKTGESGCYSCVAWSSLGISVNITQCLTIGKFSLVHEILA